MSECNLANIGTCIIEKLFDFLLYLLNLQVRPLIKLIESLLTEPVKISLFSGIWSIIIYVLSLFYGLLLLFVGLRFIVSGYSSEQRDKAKRSLANILIMMVLIQLSYFIYSLSLEVFSAMTALIFNLIDKSFFLITLDGLSNMGLDISLMFVYVFFLIITLILLVLRYICVAFGVLFFPIGIFFYFTDFLQGYGKLLINYLFVIMGTPLFYSMILLASSMLLDVGIFSNVKIIVMIGAFFLIVLSTLLLLLFVAVKAALTFISPIKKVTRLLK